MQTQAMSLQSDVGFTLRYIFFKFHMIFYLFKNMLIQVCAKFLKLIRYSVYGIFKKTGYFLKLHSKTRALRFCDYVKWLIVLIYLLSQLVTYHGLAIYLKKIPVLLRLLALVASGVILLASLTVSMSGFWPFFRSTDIRSALCHRQSGRKAMVLA